MKSFNNLLSAALLTCALASGPAMAQGLPLARYLADPEHKDDIIAFYLNALLSGISLANERATPPLFCLDTDGAPAAFELLDKLLDRMMKEKKLSQEMSLDAVVMDMLMEEFPCP